MRRRGLWVAPNSAQKSSAPSWGGLAFPVICSVGWGDAVTCFSHLCSGGEALALRSPCPVGSRGRWAELSGGWEAVLSYPKLLHPLCRVLSPQPCSPHCSQNTPPTSVISSPALLAGASPLPPGTPALLPRCSSPRLLPARSVSTKSLFAFCHQSQCCGISETWIQLFP